MWEDPIVAEVHETRKKLAAQFNFDVKAIFADMRKRQASLGDRLIPQPRSTPATESKQSPQVGVSSPIEAPPCNSSPEIS